MAEQFDGYYKWLGIPPKDQPPNHYRLLGLELFEDNAEVIETAAERQATYLHEVSSGPHVKESQKLLNEVAAARLCLLDTEKRAAYDAKLKSKLTANVTVDALPGDDSRLNDLPWDDLEPLMQNGSTSDTEPKNQAASETMPLQSESSGVFTAPKSLTDSGTLQTKKKTAKSPKQKTIWLAVGGAAVVVIVVVAVAILFATGEDASEVAKEPPQQEQPQIQTNPTTNLNGEKTSGGKTSGGKTNGGKTNGEKTNGEKTNGEKTSGEKTNGEKTSGEKTNGGKTNGGKTNGGKTNGGKTNGEKTNGGETNGVKTNGQKKRRMKPDEFITLKPLEVTSEYGTAFTVLDDNSVFAERGGSVEDIYSVTLETDISDITAIRIKAFAHEDLDFKGPGYGDKGGFGITEARVLAAPADRPAEMELVPLSGVESQEAPDGIERLIDGDGGRYWGVRPGKPTTFTLFAKSGIWHEDGSMLYVHLAQKEKLGHFCVAVSNAKELAGKKTRIEAELPLYVNLGGIGGIDAAKRNWQASRPFDGGEFGYVGGKPEGKAAGDPLGSCISGIKEFRVTLPEGKYDVVMYFSGRFPKDMSERSFEVSALGAKKQTVKNLKARETLVTRWLKGAQAKDGGLTINFKSEKGNPVLNAIGIDEAK